MKLENKYSLLQQYVSHNYPCPVWMEHDRVGNVIVADTTPCTCGLDDLLGRKVREIRAKRK